MNSPVLHDLELPPVPLPGYVWWLLALVMLLLLIAGLAWWHKRQHPVARALRQLERLPDSPPNPTALASILREAGLTSLAALDHARFAPTPCTPTPSPPSNAKPAPCWSKPDEHRLAHPLSSNPSTTSGNPSSLPPCPPLHKYLHNFS